MKLESEWHKKKDHIHLPYKDNKYLEIQYPYCSLCKCHDITDYCLHDFFSQITSNDSIMYHISNYIPCFPSRTRCMITIKLPHTFIFHPFLSNKVWFHYDAVYYMALCKRDVTPLLTNWSYISFYINLSNFPQKYSGHPMAYSRGSDIGFLWVQSLSFTNHCCSATRYISTRLILDLRPANERQCYFVMTSLIGWAQT